MNTTHDQAASGRSSARRVAALALSALGLTLSASFLTTMPASAELLNVNMQSACDKQNPGMGLTATVRDAKNPYSWVCKAPWGYQVGINVNAACADQHPNSVAKVLDPQNAYSWRCER